MRILWLSNMAPTPVLANIHLKDRGGLWLDHVLKDLRAQDSVRLRLVCAADRNQEGILDDHCSFLVFPRAKPAEVVDGLELQFQQELQKFRPDVVHIWGTEYGHTLSMLRACRKEGLLDRTVVSIQGLCSIYARHYNEGIPQESLRKVTFRDFVKQDNLLQQQKAYEARGRNEIASMELALHFIGRTEWDRACARLIHPEAAYHTCNETLREAFFEDAWSYEKCRKHSIFASSCASPIKGFHYLLEAFAEVRRRYPDAVLRVAGKSPIPRNGKERLRQDGYAAYLEKLIKKYGLQDSVEFLGSLNLEQMKENYLKANLFALPSTIENSPNSLGEAMLLGVPSVAAHVGGVATMLENGREGILYQSTAPYMLADAMEKIFSMEEKAEEMGKNAAAHGRRTHDPKKNLQDLLNIYQALAEGPET